MQRKHIGIFSIFIASILLVSVNFVPELVSSQAEPRYHTGDFIKVFMDNSRSNTGFNSFEVYDVDSNDTLVHYDENYNEDSSNGIGNMELFALGPEYEFLRDYMRNDCYDCPDGGPGGPNAMNLAQGPGYPSTIFVQRSNIEVSGNNYWERNEFESDRVNTTTGDDGWMNQTDSNPYGPFHEGRDEVFEAPYNETYSLMFEEMFLPRGNYSDYVDWGWNWLGIPNEMITFQINNGLSFYSDDFEVNGQIKTYNVREFWFSSWVNESYSFTISIPLGPDNDPYTPWVELNGTISVTASQKSFLGYDDATGQILYVDTERSVNVMTDMWNDYVSIPFYDMGPGDPPAALSLAQDPPILGYFNVSIYGDGEYEEIQSEYADIVGFGGPPQNAGTGPLLAGDSLFFETQNDQYVEVDMESGFSSSGDYWYQNNIRESESEGNVTVDVYSDHPDGFGAVVYGLEDRWVSEYGEDGDSQNGTVSDWSNVWYEDNGFIDFQPHIPYGTNQQVAHMFDDRKFIDFGPKHPNNDPNNGGDDGLWFLFSLPGFNGEVLPRGGVNSGDASGYLEINDYNFSINGEVFWQEYVSENNGEFPSGRGMPFFETLNRDGMLDEMGINEIKVIYDYRIFMNDSMGYDKSNGAFVYQGNSMEIDVTINVEVINNPLDQAPTDWYFDLSFYLESDNEMFLAESNVNYLEPPTSTIESTTTSVQGNTSTSISSSESSLDTSTTTSDVNSDTNTTTGPTTPANPLPGFEFVSAGISVFVAIALIRRKKQ